MTILDPVIDPTDDMPLDFGAHKGKTPRQLLKIEPSYLVWIYETVGAGLMTRDLYLDACFILDEDEDRRYIEDERNDDEEMRGDMA